MDREAFERCMQRRQADMVRCLDLLHTLILDALVTEHVIGYQQLEELKMMMTRPLEDWKKICACLEKYHHSHVSKMIKEAIEEANQTSAARRERDTCSTGALDVRGGRLPLEHGECKGDQRKEERGRENVMLKEEESSSGCKYSRDPDYVMDGRTFSEIEARQFSVCSIFWHHHRIGTGFYIRQGQVCTCGLICTCRFICTCWPVISDYLPKNQPDGFRKEVEGMAVNFYDHKGGTDSTFDIREILAGCPELDYAFLGLKTIPIGVRPLENFATPPAPGRKIHMIGLSGKTERMIEPNVLVVDVDSFLSENREKFKDEEIRFLKNKLNFAFHCALFHGFSGSPIFDNVGRCVGIHREGFDNNEGGPQYRIELGVKMIAVMMHAHVNFKMFPNSGNELFRRYSEI